MKALEKRREIDAAASAWRRAFRHGAQKIGTMAHEPVFWHERLGLWGLFGETHGKGGMRRGWNAFGQKPHAFKVNMVVEINAPPVGIDQNIQAVFAIDKDGCRWLLHQGRMSVSRSKVTEADFIAATGLKPTKIAFSDGSRAEYHKVANLSAQPAIVQAQMAAFVAQCALARLVKLAKGATIPDLSKVEDWERQFTPEVTGDYEIAPRAGGTGRRLHANVSKALALELKRRGTPHSNDRVLRYGPDLFTIGTWPKVLFEIKSSCRSQDIFGAVGQLQIYDQLLGGNYRKVLVVPKGMGRALTGPISSLGIRTVEFEQKGSKITFDKPAIGGCLK